MSRQAGREAGREARREAGGQGKGDIFSFVVVLCVHCRSSSCCYCSPDHLPLPLLLPSLPTALPAVLAPLLLLEFLMFCHG